MLEYVDIFMMLLFFAILGLSKLASWLEPMYAKHMENQLKKDLVEKKKAKELTPEEIFRSRMPKSNDKLNKNTTLYDPRRPQLKREQYHRKQNKYMDSDEFIKHIKSDKFKKLKFDRWIYDDKKCFNCKTPVTPGSSSAFYKSHWAVGMELMKDIVTLCDNCYVKAIDDQQKHKTR